MGRFCDTRQPHAVAFLPKPSRFTSLCVNLGPFVGQRLPELLPELGLQPRSLGIRRQSIILRVVLGMLTSSRDSSSIGRGPGLRKRPIEGFKPRGACGELLPHRTVFAVGGETIGLLGGTLLQLAVPVVLAVALWRSGDRHGATVPIW
jgi:hypothetical protein